jgi:TolA-binding protein
MDSDKFDRIVLDLLYGELDELTTAAARRHMDQSARARDIYAHLRATRQLGVLPAHTPPPDFEATLLESEARLLAELPLRHRLGRLVSMLAGYAMRPQLIMAALLLLMIGSSLMFVRARPGLHSPVQVTERGAPEAEVDLVLPLAPSVHASEAAAVALLGSPLPATPPTNAQAESAPPTPAQLGAAPEREAGRLVIAADAGGGLDPYEQAQQVYRAGSYVEARRLFERIRQTGGKHAGDAALYSAITTRNISGCAPALVRFERVQLAFPDSAAAHEATWRSARCQEQLGDASTARQSYESLLRIPSHARRAEQALAALARSVPAPADTPVPADAPAGGNNAPASP